MKKTINISGLEIEVVPDKAIIDGGHPVMVVRLKEAHQPLEKWYVPGTMAGYHCSVCDAECILAPSGQAIHAAGKNPLICMQCAMKLAGEPQ